MRTKAWKWALGLTYIVAVSSIWIAASFVVQSVVDAGVSPFLVTYICNSLFVVYIPLVEICRCLEDNYSQICFWRTKESSHVQEVREAEQVILLGNSDSIAKPSVSFIAEEDEVIHQQEDVTPLPGNELKGTLPDQESLIGNVDEQVDCKGRWTRKRVAKVSLLICPFWFFAQLTFNLSLKYTTVTSNTILSSASSLFTFLVSLIYLGERFTWIKLASVLLCMTGTVIVSLGDSKSSLSAIASNALLGDILAILSAGLYAVYITLIRKMLPDDDEKGSQASMAQFLGYLGLFNIIIFLPIAFVLSFTKLEHFDMLNKEQLSLIVGKGFLDNVLSDYLWAKAVLLTTTTVATAGLTIQVPLAAIVDTVTGNAPRLLDYLGAVAVLIGFTGINIPADSCGISKDTMVELEESASPGSAEHVWPTRESSN